MSLPTPPPDFHWTNEPWGPMLRCRALDGVAQHGFTSRQLQLRPGEGAGDGWARAAASVGCALPRIGRVRQVHGAVVRVVHVSELAAPVPDADAVVTRDAGTAVAVVAADCVPILLADPVSGAVAAVHAGWRGTAADVAGATVATLTREWGVAAASLVAAVGPSIGPCCYTVGPELLTSFEAAGHAKGMLARWFTLLDDRLVLDLWAATRDLLEASGVTSANIHVAGLCTQTHNDVFESFRADGDRAGRMAALIVAP
ncbi:MAG: peptidoglycan editing factor PgeF [Acidobacteria bacterium]|nr:peptidoglycan editing factor PgeF [Acidobacteriota bacterium]